MDIIIDVGTELFGVARVDAKNALFAGGTVYLAECARNAKGYHFKPD